MKNAIFHDAQNLTLIDRDQKAWAEAFEKALPTIRQSNETYKLPLRASDNSYALNEWGCFKNTKEVSAKDMSEDWLFTAIRCYSDLVDRFEENNHDYVQTVLDAVDAFAIV
jgi:hypothetical protein